ncbi:MAG TPA: TIGR04255 family protein [Blastocatellia bacterium]|nr:TIGR04255 family protein [Blastocatellia bacterium]
MAQTLKLPKFDNPPLIEAALGIEFEPLQRWDILHFGLFWGQIRNKYPQYIIQPPLDSQLEVFGESNKQVTMTFPFVGPPEVRCWFINQPQTWLLQVQRERVVLNWRKTPAAGEYPRFHKLQTRFEEEWLQFRTFVKDNDVGDLKPLQCELSYFNHIELPDGWRETEILSSYFPCWTGGSSGSFLPVPEIVTINTRYTLPENQGRLHISMQPVFRHADAKEVIQLTVTARVLSDPDIQKAIQIAHEWAVCGFTDFTSSAMHDLWGRRQ